MRVTSGETLEIVGGTFNAEKGTFTLKDGQLARAKLAEEALSVDAIELTSLRSWDDLAALLPGTAASDDLAIIEGTYATDAPTIQTSDADSTTVTQRLRFRRSLGPEYVDAASVTLRVRAGMVTTVSDTTATVDVECYEDDGDGGISADLCATAAMSINSVATATDKDFVITPTGLASGSVLDFRVTIAITDGSTGAVVLGEITRIALLRDVKG